MASGAVTRDVAPPPRPRPDLFRVLVRSLVACVLVEVATFAALVATGWEGNWPAWAYVLGWGVGAGAALAVAEATLWRVGLLPALVAGACLSLLAPLGGAFELTFVQRWSSHEATQAVLDALDERSALSWVGHALGALFVYGPLLVALHRRASPVGQAVAMAIGAACFAGLAFLFGPWQLARATTWNVLPLLLFAPAFVVPPARRAGDRLAQAVRLRAGPPRVPLAASASRWVAHLLLAALAPGLYLALRHGSTEAIEVSRERWNAEGRGDVAAMIALGDRDTSHWKLPWYSWAPSSVPVEAPRVLGISLEVLTGLRGWGQTVRAVFSWPGVPTPVQGSTDLLGWYRLAAARGDLTAMHRLAEHVDDQDVRGSAKRAQSDEALAWWRQAAVAGDPPAMVELGRRLAEGPWPTLSNYGPPPPGEVPASSQAAALEGLDWLARAHAAGEPRAASYLLRGLRLSPSATRAEASARLQRGIELWHSLLASGSPRLAEELAALHEARLALDAWGFR